MSKVSLVDPNFPDCPIRNVLSRICDKWSVLVLYTLKERNVVRFKELQRSIPDISQKMLTVTLRTLETDGIVSRKVYAEVPPKVEYSLTERGASFIPHVEALIAWAQDNLTDIIATRTRNS